MALLLSITAACERSPTVSDQPRQLFTLFQIQDALHAGTLLPVGPDFPGGGIAPQTVLTDGDSGDSLVVSPAFSEGEPAAYVTTELWTHFDEVWVQPWYVLITVWNDKAPRQNQLKDGQGNNTPPLIDVGPDSAFYSPYWQVFYVVVPPETPPDKYTSTRQLFDDHLPMYPGTPWFYTVRPDDVVLTTAKPLHPILGQEVSNLSAAPSALIEGRSVPYFSVGGNNFRYDEKLVVEEVPLFIFVRRDAAGAPVNLGAPNVVGSSPLFSRRPADVANGQPRFGAYVRLHLAFVPAAAAAFDPAAYPNTVARLAALPSPIDPKIFQGRVALNGRKVAATDVDCFADEAFPATCRWLDSQQRVEDALGRSNIERTAVTAATPLVFFGAKP